MMLISESISNQINGTAYIKVYAVPNLVIS